MNDWVRAWLTQFPDNASSSLTMTALSEAEWKHAAEMPVVNTVPSVCVERLMSTTHDHHSDHTCLMSRCSLHVTHSLELWKSRKVSQQIALFRKGELHNVKQGLCSTDSLGIKHSARNKLERSCSSSCRNWLFMKIAENLDCKTTVSTVSFKNMLFTILRFVYKENATLSNTAYFSWLLLIVCQIDIPVQISVAL